MAAIPEAGGFSSQSPMDGRLIEMAGQIISGQLHWCAVVVVRLVPCPPSQSGVLDVLYLAGP